MSTGNRRALVTGATGFVGRHLVRRLVREGWTVGVVARPRSALDCLAELSGWEVYRHDGTTEGLSACVQQAQPDVIFHLASLFLASHRPEDVQPLIESNLLFGTQLAQAAADHGVRCFLNTGTAWQHFEGPGYDPVCLYAATKEAFEKILEFYTATGQLRVLTLYLFDTYGPDDPRPKLLRALGDAARNGTTLQMSPGAQRIDLTHIDDVSRAFVVAAERLLAGSASEPFERYGVCSGERQTLREVVELYGELVGKPLKAVWGGRPYRDREVMEPWHPPQLLPGWQPSRSLREGLRELIAETTK